MKKNLFLNPIFVFKWLLLISIGITIADPAFGATRFAVSPENVIFDSETGLEWVAGPDKNTNYEKANQWVAGCNTAGGGWRMPTREELLGIYQKDIGERNLDPVFKITGFYVWAELRNKSYAWAFNFGIGEECWFTQRTSNFVRALGVRSTIKSNSKSDSSTKVDLAGGTKRFNVTTKGVISDSKTGFEWVMGPDRDMNYDQASKWVAGCSTASGGWRMPTRKELAKLYQKGIGDDTIDPVFKGFGRCVWAEPRNSSSACFYNFDQGFGYWCSHNVSGGKRAWGIRSRP